jgi:hypothetical protein
VRSGFSGNYALRLRDGDMVLRPAGTVGATDGRHWVTGAEVIEALPAGDHAEHVVRLGDQTLYIAVPAALGVLQPGDKVDLGLNPAHVLVYDVEGCLVQDWAASADQRYRETS